MNCETNQVINNAAMLLKLENGAAEEALAFLAEDCVNAVLTYCRLDFLPYQLIGLTARMTADMYRTECENGGRDISSVTEGDRKIDFSVPIKNIEAYAERLRPFMNIKGRLPSEKGAE